MRLSTGTACTVSLYLILLRANVEGDIGLAHRDLAPLGLVALPANHQIVAPRGQLHAGPVLQWAIIKFDAAIGRGRLHREFVFFRRVK